MGKLCCLMKVRDTDQGWLIVYYSYHSLHFFGDLVAPQVVVKWPVGPVRAVVGDAVCPLPIHLGNHGLFFFLLEGTFKLMHYLFIIILLNLINALTYY